MPVNVPLFVQYTQKRSTWNGFANIWIEPIFSKQYQYLTTIHKAGEEKGQTQGIAGCCYIFCYLVLRGTGYRKFALESKGLSGFFRDGATLKPR